jgi:hypothetical protein
MELLQLHDLKNKEAALESYHMHAWHGNVLYTPAVDVKQKATPVIIDDARPPKGRERRRPIDLLGVVRVVIELRVLGQNNCTYTIDSRVSKVFTQDIEPQEYTRKKEQPQKWRAKTNGCCQYK